MVPAHTLCAVAPLLFHDALLFLANTSTRRDFTSYITKSHTHTHRPTMADADGDPPPNPSTILWRNSGLNVASTTTGKYHDDGWGHEVRHSPFPDRPRGVMLLASTNVRARNATRFAWVPHSPSPHPHPPWCPSFLHVPPCTTHACKQPTIDWRCLSVHVHQLAYGTCAACAWCSFARAFLYCRRQDVPAHVPHSPPCCPSLVVCVRSLPLPPFKSHSQ
jgi:hypothetical protein